MVQLLKSSQRGQASHGWLDSYHTFSFADYYNPDWMGYGDLRVINEDFIASSSGFSTHGHRDMEIITYVVEGALEHKDNMGNSAIIRPGEVQVMSAGKGVLHSEFNPLNDQTSHIIQIWILPHTKRVTPRYDQKDFSQDYKNNMRVHVVTGQQSTSSSIYIYQDANIYVTNQTHSGSYGLELDAKRRYWVQLIKGNLELEFNQNTSNPNKSNQDKTNKDKSNQDKLNLEPGDAAFWQGETHVSFLWPQTAEFLFFDLPS